MRQGEKGDSLFIIEKGEVTVLDERGGNRQIAVLKENNVVGELALATGAPRSATVVANTDTKVMLILKENFDHLIKSSPETAAALKDIVSSRLNELKEGGTISREQSEEWINKATRKIDTRIISPTDAEITEEVTSHGGAPLAIWLGILLDGIPESLVIGSSMLLHPVSVSLIAGLFLSNFPEALSSSVGMREQKYSKGKIMLLWSSLMIITGIGALLGNVLLNGASHHSLTFIEGLAAGAMLTMIAETMLPEAFHKGGNVVGLSTLAGFLAAILCGVLSH
jgi:CRP-like cAMP-binding protein